MAAHRLDPLRVDDARPHDPRCLLREGAHLRAGRVGRVAEPRFRPVAAPQGTDGRDHAAVLLQVVVRVEDVVLAVVLVLDRDIDRGEATSHRGLGRTTHAGASVAVPAPREVDRGEIVVGSPVA